MMVMLLLHFIELEDGEAGIDHSGGYAHVVAIVPVLGDNLHVLKSVRNDSPCAPLHNTLLIAALNDVWASSTVFVPDDEDPNRSNEE